MSGETLRRTVKITDPVGFHLRPATAFAQLAGKFACDLTVIKGNQRVNGKSPLELLFLGAGQETELVLEASGPDAQAALDALEALLKEAPPQEVAGEPPASQSETASKQSLRGT